MILLSGVCSTRPPNVKICRAALFVSLALGILVVALAAEAQQTGKAYRMGLALHVRVELAAARDASVEGDALTSPSRASNPRKLSPPVCTPTIRRRRPQRGHWKTSRANTRRSSAAHEELSPCAPKAPGPGSASGPVPSLGTAAVGPSSIAAWRRGMTAERHPACGPRTP